VTGQWLRKPVSRHDRAAQIDARHAHPARVYDFWLGGKDNFAADREAAREAMTANPEIVTEARANRAFLVRAVHYLAARSGVRQFLDIGSGLPAAPNTHEVAQGVAAESRVVYVDNDPIVLTHSRAMLVSGPEGRCDYVDTDLRDPAAILEAAAATLDFRRPVAVLLMLVLHLIPDPDSPREIVTALLRALPAGSYLALSHPASDLRTAETGEMTRRLNQRMSGTLATLRDRAQVAEYFAGLDLVEPGLVQPQRWRPGPAAADDGPGTVAVWCGVARTG
jgi:hypothetical protein